MRGLERIAIAFGSLVLVALPVALHGWPTTLRGNLFTLAVMSAGLSLMWWRSHPRAAPVMARVEPSIGSNAALARQAIVEPEIAIAEPPVETALSSVREVEVDPDETREAEGAIERAIRDSDLGLNPATMGELIRVPMPMLTEERRRELTKVVRHEGETAKIAVRNLRRDGNGQLKDAVKDKTISEDDERRAEEQIQKLTDRYVGEIDKLLEQKEQELMQI